MKNLMIIIQSLEGGGQERIAALTTFALKNDYNIYFVVFDGRDKKYDISEEIKYINLSIMPHKNKVFKFFCVLKKIYMIKKLKIKYGINTTISFGRPANIINCISKSRDKVISSIRNSSYLETEKHNLINKIIYRFSDAVVFISKGQRDKTKKFFPLINNKSYVIYNPCDLKKIDNLKKEKINFSIPKEDLLVSCARIEDVKCFVNLCNSFKIAKQKCGKLKLFIIGEGSKKEILKQHIKYIGMERDIILLGYQKNPFKYMIKCKMFVYASASEGFGNVLTEALACGLPVVSTDYLYGAREILGGDYDYKIKDDYKIEKFGLLTPVFTIGGKRQSELERIFADAIIRLISDELLYEQLKSVAYLRASNFSIENYRKQWMEII